MKAYGLQCLVSIGALAAFLYLSGIGQLVFTMYARLHGAFAHL